jgi:hypothetical protein
MFECSWDKIKIASRLFGFWKFYLGVEMHSE